jgi:hypothetical protein
MIQIVNSSSYPEWPNLKVDYHKPIKLFMDKDLTGYDKNEECFNILFTREPSALLGIVDYVNKNKDMFDAILTYDEDILKLPNSYFFPFGTSWVKEYDHKLKNFSVSHLTGFKLMLEGHGIRHEVNFNQDKINIPKAFFISNRGRPTPNPFNNPEIGEKKEPLFHSEFCICIENTKQNNFFTEKLIDCLVTKTVPIFYGADNIGEFFNTNGFIIANSTQEIIEKCNSLDETSYSKMIPAIEDNYERSKKYSDIKPMLKETIERVIKEVIC